MGNSKSKDENRFLVAVRLSKFAIASVPHNPSPNRIDYKVMSEFTSICYSVLPDDANERRQNYDKWDCYFSLGVVSFVIGLGAAISMSISGGVLNILVLWLFGIILGILGIFGGATLALTADQKKGVIKHRFNRDVRSNLNMALIPFNHKYQNKISFTPKGSGGYILIDVYIHVKRVQFIPDQSQINMEQQPPGQLIIVQLPDGRMVPAQIQSSVQQQQVQQTQHVSIAAYNPDAIDNDGGQNAQYIKLNQEPIEMAIAATFNPEVARMLNDDENDEGEGMNATNGEYNYE